MKNIFNKKVLVVISIASLAVSVGAVAYADSTLRQISAYQNQALKVTVNGSSVDMSSEDGTMYPIVYEGHSYVSAKAVAEKLGASVKWNADTQTVEITSGSGAGIPDKDNTTPPVKTTPTPTPSSSSNAVSSGGFTSKLSMDFNKDTLAKDNVDEALAFAKLYAQAIKSGNMDAVNKFIEGSLPKDKPAQDTFWHPETTKEKLKQSVDSTRKSNDQDMLDKWANAIIKLTINDVEIGYTSKLDSIASIQYTLQPEGFNAFSSLTFSLKYEVPYKEDKYWLDYFYVL